MFLAHLTSVMVHFSLNGVSRVPLTFAQRATYASAAGLSREDITSRVLEVVKSFEKVDPTKASYLRLED